jgi:hypothetical protein
VIAEATTALSQEAARAVEAKIPPAAGDMTYAQLRAAVRRAVIAADPEGAEQAARNGNAEVRQSRLRQLDGMAQLTAAPRSSNGCGFLLCASDRLPGGHQNHRRG